MQYTAIFHGSKNKKIMNIPCKPQFYYIKVGFKGVYIARACYEDTKIKRKRKKESSCASKSKVNIKEKKMNFIDLTFNKIRSDVNLNKIFHLLDFSRVLRKQMRKTKAYTAQLISA